MMEATTATPTSGIIDIDIQDLDAVGLITSEIETNLPDVLLARLREIRAIE